MEISSSTENGIAVVSIEGNLDTTTSTDALDHISGLMDGGESKILVDFTAVDFVASSGLRILLVTAKRLKSEGGSLRICGLNESVNEVFEMSGFSTILNVFPSRDDALSGF